MEKLEVYVTDTSLTITRKEHTLVKFTVRPDHTVHAQVSPEAVTDVAWVLEPAMDGQPLTVDVITYEKDPESMALARARRETATTKTITPKTKRITRHYDTNTDTISANQSDKILDEILKAMKANPNMTKAQVSKDSHRIADKLGVRVMAVAGVRANFSRGTYGNPKTLLRQR